MLQQYASDAGFGNREVHLQTILSMNFDMLGFNKQPVQSIKQYEEEFIVKLLLIPVKVGSYNLLNFYYFQNCM